MTSSLTLLLTDRQSPSDVLSFWCASCLMADDFFHRHTQHLAAGRVWLADRDLIDSLAMDTVNQRRHIGKSAPKKSAQATDVQPQLFREAALRGGSQPWTPVCLKLQGHVSTGGLVSVEVDAGSLTSLLS